MPKGIELGQIGVHLVCAELYRIGMIAELVHRNAKGIDIIVYDPKNTRGTALQVKTSNDKGDKTVFNICTTTPKKWLQNLILKIRLFLSGKKKIQLDFL